MAESAADFISEIDPGAGIFRIIPSSHHFWRDYSEKQKLWLLGIILKVLCLIF